MSRNKCTRNYSDLLLLSPFLSFCTEHLAYARRARIEIDPTVTYGCARDNKERRVTRMGSLSRSADRILLLRWAASRRSFILRLVAVPRIVWREIENLRPAARNFPLVREIGPIKWQYNWQWLDYVGNSWSWKWTKDERREEEGEGGCGYEAAGGNMPSSVWRVTNCNGDMCGSRQI